MQRRLNIKAQFAERGVFSPVCYSCYIIDNGWFSDKTSPAYQEASQGRTRSRMTDFDTERKYFVEEKKRALKVQRETAMTSAWKVDLARQLAISYQPEMSTSSKISRKLARNSSDLSLRQHWINERSISSCQNNMCRLAFTINERKHHCRICGKVFCDACSPKQLNILQFLPDDVSSSFADDAGPDEDESRGLERCCHECVRDLAEHTALRETRLKLEGAGAHVLCNLYAPIPGYTREIDAALDKLRRATLYLSRITELATGPDAIELTEMAIADVHVVKAPPPPNIPPPPPPRPFSLHCGPPERGGGALLALRGALPEDPQVGCAAERASRGGRGGAPPGLVGWGARTAATPPRAAPRRRG